MRFALCHGLTRRWVGETLNTVKTVMICYFV